MFSSFRPFLAFFTAALLVCPFSLAYQSPLSEESIREAYFLGKGQLIGQGERTHQQEIGRAHV